MTPGKPLAAEYVQESIELVQAGMANLRAHIENARAFGVPVVVAVNAFDSDTPRELDLVCNGAKEAGAFDAVVTRHHAKGGAGAVALAEAVARAADAPKQPRYLYPLEYSIAQKIETLATTLYRAARVEFSPTARKQMEQFEAMGLGGLPVCIAKTHLSLSHDPALKNAPRDFVFPIRELRPSAGAGFVYALAGEIRTMPGLPSTPAFRGVDIDPDTGRISGLF